MKSPREGKENLAVTPERKEPYWDSADLSLLPAYMQADIIDHMNEHTKGEAIEWLAEKGIRTRMGFLNNFKASYEMRQRLQRLDTLTGIWMEYKARLDPSLTPKRIRKMGQMLFSSLAIEKQDPKSWKIVPELELKRSEMELAQKRFHAERAKPEEKREEGKAGMTERTRENIEDETKLL